MKSSCERFIEAAVTPLEDNAELKVAATCEVSDILAANPTPAECLLHAASRLDGNPRGGRIWRPSLYLITAVVSAILLYAGWKTHGMPHLIKKLLPSPGGGISFEPKSTWRESLSADQELLLFGDSRKGPRSEKFKALWESAPQSPAFFAEYAVLHEKDHSSLPPDFAPTARKLDPDNAWFTLFHASVVAKDSVERAKLTNADKRAGKLPTLTILDEARYREALELLFAASLQPSFVSYESALLSQRIALLPRRTDVPSQIAPANYIAGQPAHSLSFRSLASVVETRSIELTGQGDAEEFRKLSLVWWSCLSKWSEAGKLSLLDVLMLRACLGQTAPRFRDNAERLGLHDLARQWQRIADHLEADKKARETDPPGPETYWKSSAFGGMLLMPSSNLSGRTPDLTGAELLPGRWADHEFFRRSLSPLMWLILGAFALGAALFRFRGNRLVRPLAAHFERLLRPADWAWIVAAALLPLGYYQAIDRLTPWGGRSYNAADERAFALITQLAATLGLVLLLPALIAGWRLGKRGPMLGFRKGMAGVQWAGIALIALFIPAVGAAGNISETAMKVILGALAAPIAWMAGRALLGSSRELMRRSVVSRTLVPAYVAGMLVIISLTPFYHAEEKRWLSLDRLTEIDPESPAWTRYEFEVAQALRKELRDLLHP